MRLPPDLPQGRNGTKTLHNAGTAGGARCPAPLAMAAAHEVHALRRATSRSLAEKAAGRTFQPVRRSSYDVNDKRAQVFRPIAGGSVGKALRWCDKLVQTAQEYDDTHKAHGSRLGPLGDSGVRILDTIVRRCLDFGTGRCEPSIETIMRYTRYARATVVDALRRLKQHGFLNWVRRTRPTGNARGEGPLVAQMSNAYFFDLASLAGKAKQRFQQLLGGRRAAEEAKRQKEAQEAEEARLRTLPASQMGSELVGKQNPQLAAILNSLGAAIEGQEASAPCPSSSESDSASSVSEQNPPPVS